MPKVVINACFGGFSLSDKAMKLLAEAKRMKCVTDNITSWRGWSHCTIGWLHDVYEGDINSMPMELREDLLSDRQIPRNDRDLIAVVEELGKEANGRHARLRIIEIPSGVEWYIAEYDGNEHVAETHRTWA